MDKKKIEKKLKEFWNNFKEKFFCFAKRSKKAFLKVYKRIYRTFIRLKKSFKKNWHGQDSKIKRFYMNFKKIFSSFGAGSRQCFIRILKNKDEKSFSKKDGSTKISIFSSGRKKKVSFCEEYLLVTIFSLVLIFFFISFINPFNANKNSLVLSNQREVDSVDGIERIRLEAENRLIESFPLYDSLLKGYFSLIRKINETSLGNVNDDELTLISSAKRIYTNKDNTNLIIRYEYSDDEAMIQLNNRINFFNNLYVKLKENGVNLSIYTVNSLWTSEAILNFDVDEKDPLKYVKYFKKGINENIKFDYLKMIDFQTYKEYFFKTDHHWKIQGAYEGYKDIMHMYNYDNELVPPNFFVVNDLKFIGSNARACAYDKIYDEIYDIKFDKEYKVKKNGKNIPVSDLSMKKKYLSGDFDKEEFYNHYGRYFRQDTGEIVYTFKENEDRKNILIIADSFSNCIENLIASHFYNTHVIDLRYYESDMNKKFNIYQYVKDNDIDEVLFLYSANYIYFESGDVVVE